MASVVQAEMEAMVPELEDLQLRGIFSADEVKALAKKRRDFEYLLQRRTPRREDFVRYVEYELKVEKLRKARTKRREIHTSGPSDYGGLRRIQAVYARALRKFSSDLALWNDALDHGMRTGSTHNLSKLFARALQLHPRVAGLWIKAAKYEFERKGDVGAARALMQRAIRTNRASEVLWHEYYRLELLVLSKLRARRAVLGIDDVANGDAADAADAADGEGTQQAEEAATRRAERSVLLDAAVPRVVYKNAVAAMPEKLSFRLGFVEILEAFVDGGGGALGGLPTTLVHTVLDDAAEAFPSDEAVWEARASAAYRFPPLQGEEEEGNEEEERDALSPPQRRAMVEFRRGLAALPTPRMAELFAEFCFAQAAQAAADDGGVGGGGGAALRRALAHVVGLSGSQRDHGGPAPSERSCELLLQSLLLRCGDDGEAAELDAAAERATRLHPSCAKLWLLRFERCERRAPEAAPRRKRPRRLERSESGRESLQEAFETAVAAVPVRESLPLWQYYLQATLSGGGEGGDIAEAEATWALRTFRRAVVTFVSDGRASDPAVQSLLCALLQWAHYSGGAALLRRAHTETLKSGAPPQLPEAYFVTYAALELGEGENGSIAAATAASARAALEIGRV